MDRNAVVPVGGLLLANEGGSAHSSILLHGPISGNLEAAGHAADALVSAGHLAALKGGTAAAGRESSPVG